jgi:ABC-type Na+ efflux pump permease subunit
LSAISRGAQRRVMPTLLSDTLAIAWRGVITCRRVPQLLVFSTIQLVVFVLLFTSVFGGAIHVPGVDYVDYLMPGIFVQTVVFGAIATAIGLATDVQSGLLERLRALPMPRSAVLTGRTIADLFRNVFVVILMAGVGFLVGLTVHTNAANFVAAMLLVLLFGYSMSWVFATVGLLLGNSESPQAAAFPVMAARLRLVGVRAGRDDAGLAAAVCRTPTGLGHSLAARALTLGTPATSYVLQSLAWVAGILLVFVRIAVRRYRRAV